MGYSADTALLKRLVALVESLPINKKKVVFINKLKGEVVPEDSENVLLIVFDLGDE